MDHDNFLLSYSDIQLKVQERRMDLGFRKAGEKGNDTYYR